MTQSLGAYGLRAMDNPRGRPADRCSSSPLAAAVGVRGAILLSLVPLGGPGEGGLGLGEVALGVPSAICEVGVSLATPRAFRRAR
jgi:hypothetical protein